MQIEAGRLTFEAIRDHLDEFTIRPLKDDLSDVEAVEMLEMIGDIKSTAGQIERLLRRDVAGRFLGSGANIGNYVLEARMVGAKYDFDGELDEELFKSVVARGRDRQLFDRETGEILESEGEAVARTIAEIWKLGARTARSGALKDKLGLSIDLYRTRTQGGIREAAIVKQRS